MPNPSKKILIAAGGTGGHVFPAQALARQLTEKDADYQIFFMGKGLDTNKYFQKKLFAYQSIDSATPFKKGLLKKMGSFFSLLKGTLQAFFLIRQMKPSLVVGFGSFHAFPVLAAAWIQRIPMVLFESNSVPGKVNRLFSRYAICSAVHFPKAKEFLKGTCLEVHMPFWGQQGSLTREQSRSYFSLAQDPFTCLVFGGSQGALSINRVVAEAFQGLSLKEFQVIHITGNNDSVEEIQKLYREYEISACVKSFESSMHFAWSSADMVICRAGAATLAELMVFEVPGILIPYPQASEQHQLKNALFLQEEVGGAFCLEEKHMTPQKLLSLLQKMSSKEIPMLQKMKSSIQEFKKEKQKKHLSELIEKIINT